jgi:hypothetical protein
MYTTKKKNTHTHTRSPLSLPAHHSFLDTYSVDIVDSVAESLSSQLSLSL